MIKAVATNLAGSFLVYHPGIFNVDFELIRNYISFYLLLELKKLHIKVAMSEIGTFIFCLSPMLSKIEITFLY